MTFIRRTDGTVVCSIIKEWNTKPIMFFQYPTQKFDSKFSVTNLMDEDLWGKTLQILV
jgi:hypothetical protein